MIANAILTLLTAIFNGLYAIMPDWNITQLLFNPDVAGGLTWSADLGWVSAGGGGNAVQLVIYYLNKYDAFLPVHETWAAMSFTAVFFVAMWAFRGIKWVAGMIRGAGTS